MLCGRLLVMSERERRRLSTPLMQQQHLTLDVRLRVLERKGLLMATLAQHDELGRGFVEEAHALSSLQHVLQLPAPQCQALIDMAVGPARAPAAGGEDGATATRKIEYSLLGAFRVVMARPAVAAFCGPACSGCSAVAETFLSRQIPVLQALRDAAARWRKTPEGSAVSATWGVGVVPYTEFEAVLCAELCGESVGGGEWNMRHVRSIALAQPRLVVHVDVPAAAAAPKEPRNDTAPKTRHVRSCVCHVVRIEGLGQRFAALEASDAAALARLASFPHQRALALAYAAYMRHHSPAQTPAPAYSVPWEKVREAKTAAALLLAVCSALSPPLKDGGGVGSDEASEEEDEDVLPCGDLEAMVSIWGRGAGVEEVLASLVPVYCHMLPASTIVLSAHKTIKKVKTASRKPNTAASKAAAGGLAGGRGEEGADGLTRGQQVFRKLLAGRRPGVMQILQAMGAMTPTCVPSPLNDATKKFAVATSAHVLAALDSASIRCLQLSFIEAVGVPGPGERYLVLNRMLKVSLFDAYMMKFVGVPLAVELTAPKDDKPHHTESWAPAKSAPKIFVSADLKTHAQMYLYFELHQLSQRKSDTAGKEVMHVSCGHALLSLKETPNGTSGKRELAVSGGTPFMPKAITKEVLGAGKSSGFLARLRTSTSKSQLTIKLEKVDKHTLEMVLSPLPHLLHHTISFDSLSPFSNFSNMRQLTGM